MGEPERIPDNPTGQLENADKPAVATTDERKAAEQEANGNATVVNNEQQAKAAAKASELNSSVSEINVGMPSSTKLVLTPSKMKEQKPGDHSTANGKHPSHKSNTVKPSGTENHSSRGSAASALAMPTLVSTDTGVASSVSNNTIDCNDTPTNESTSTPPDQQSRQSKKETILYDDSQQSSQSQVVVAVPQQQTVYYQIPQLPSVVTLPVESSQDVVPKNGMDQQEPIEQQQIQYTNQHQIAMAHSHLPIQTEDQIIGMVGAIPIIKMQGGGMHYVKEKKGRFNLLQTTPVIPNVVGVTQTATATSQTQGEEPRNTTGAPVSNDSTSRSHSPIPVITTSSSVQTVPQTFDGKSAPTVKRKGRFVVTNVKDPGSIIQIQTKSTPAVAVISATDSNTTSSQQEQQQQPQQQQQEQHQQVQPQPVQQQQQQVHQPSQQPPVQQPPVQKQPIQQQALQPVQQPIQQPVQQLVQQNNYHQQMSPLQTPVQAPLQTPPIPIMQQTLHQSNVSQIPLQPVMIQPVSTIQQTYEIPQQYQQNYSQHPVSTSHGNHEQFSQVPVRHYPHNLQPQTVQYTSVHPTNRQQNYVQYVPQVQHTLYASNQPTHNTGEPLSVTVPQEQQVIYDQQYQQHLPKQHYSPRPSHVQSQQIYPSPSFPVNQQTVSQNRYTPTPPTTPGGSISSPMHSRPAATSTLPNAPIPKPTTTNLEKQPPTKPVNKKKTTIQGRSGKVPQSFDSNGGVSSIGLGKVFYLLDQMKTEVTDADQCIKTLQTDMKLLVRATFVLFETLCLFFLQFMLTLIW